MSNIELVICTEQGYLESLSKLLIFSIRNFGGVFKDIPIISYQPRKGLPVSKETLSFFESHRVEHIELNLNKAFHEYPLANKPLACAHREKHTSADILIFMDSDIFFLNEPAELINFGNADLMMRPVDMKNVGTDKNKKDENSAYWESLYKLLNVKVRRFVTSTVDNQTILEYYNSGQVVVKKEKALFAHWEENFIKVMKAGVMPKQGNFFVEQSVLAATISQQELTVKQLDKHYNFPLHLMNEIQNTSYAVNSFDQLVTLHYHTLFQNKNCSNPLEHLLSNSKNGCSINQKLKEFKVLGYADQQQSGHQLVRIAKEYIGRLLRT